MAEEVVRTTTKVSMNTTVEEIVVSIMEVAYDGSTDRET